MPATHDAKEVLKRGLSAYGAATSAVRPWPDFLVVGTKRGGTTSLFRYLLSHPGVVPLWPTRRMKSPHYFDRHYDLGARWYRGHFATRYQRRLVARRHGPRSVTGEASPYYMSHPLVAERVHADMPHAKIIMMLRNPVSRAYSHYWERVDAGTESLSFEAALDAEPQRIAGELQRMTTDPHYYSQAHDFFGYRDRGIYAAEVQRWLERFPTEQLLILRSEDFYADMQRSVDAVCDFLQISRHELPPDPHHNNRPASPMDPRTKAELADFYRPHNAALAELLGRDFEWH